METRELVFFFMSVCVCVCVCVTHPEAFLLAELRFDLDGFWVIIGDKPAVSSHALRGDAALVDLLLGASPREVAILERALLAADPFELLPGARGVQEAAAEDGDAQQDLLPRHARDHQVVDRTRTGRLVFVHGVQLSVVAGPVGPRAAEIIRQEVDKVQVLGCGAEVDVLQHRHPGGQCGGEDIVVIR